MSIDTSAFFDSPPRKGGVDSFGAALDVDTFLQERGLLNIRGDDNEDALTEGTSPKTGATTPARSDGWVIEEEEAEEGKVVLKRSYPEKLTILTRCYSSYIYYR